MRFAYDFVMTIFVLALLLVAGAQHTEIEELKYEFASADKYFTNKMMSYDQVLASGRNFLERLHGKVQKLHEEQVAINFILNLHREYLKTDAEEIDELRQFWADIKDKVTLLAWLHDNNWEAMKANVPEDLVFITRDWKIRQMPKWLDLQDGDEDFLKKFLEIKD